MKATEKELVNAITVYTSYLNAKADFDKINEILSLYKVGNRLGFHIEFSLHPLKMADNEFDEYCKNVDIITPLMEYYKKELEKIKQKLKEYGVEFDD